MDIREKAQELEKKVEDGQFQAVGDELHDMSKADRIAVANQIKADQQQKPSDVDLRVKQGNRLDIHSRRAGRAQALMILDTGK